MLNSKRPPLAHCGRLPDDADLRMRKLSSERRFGHRRLYILLKREGVEVNWQKLYRLYKQERLTVGKRGGRKRALGIRAPMAIPRDQTSYGWSSHEEDCR